MTSPSLQHVPLSSLSIDATNVRKTGRGAEPAFAASIRAKGIIEPLTARMIGKGSGIAYTITNGGKRFEALCFLRDKKDQAAGIAVTGDYPVPIIVRQEDDAEARETSLITNIIRSDMHPVDQFEAFASMVADGHTITGIARTYAMKEREVKQALALGALAPAIREAWRSDKIDQEAAAAFTIEPNHQRQEAVYKRLSKSGHLYRYGVRQALAGDQGGAATLLKFVGKDLYEKAGGAVTADLFTEHREDAVVVNHPELLKRLADDKLEAECKRLVEKDGCSWAEIDDTGRRYQMDKIGKKPSEADKKQSGCLVFVDHAGKLGIERGVLKSKAKAAGEKAAGTKAKAKKTGEVSNALKQRLRTQMLVGTKKALVADSYGDELAILLAKIVASQIDTNRTWNSVPHEIERNLAEIRNGISPNVMNEAARAAFDAKDYFASVPKQLCLAAATEAVNADEARKIAGKPKAEIAKWCVANVPKTKWLPAELRTANYDGPARAAPKKPATKGKTKAAR